MIDNKELRIGNYIKPITSGIKDFHTIVLGMFKDKVMIPYKGEAEPVYLSYFKPIPLTEEWLIKFGFKKGKDNDRFCFYYDNGRNGFLTLSYNKDGYYRCFLGSYLVGVKIKSVHQLQNLYFALTNTELITQ